MEYKKIIDLLDNETTLPPKFRTKNWVEINHQSRGTYNTKSEIKSKTARLKTSFCDYSDAYILVKRTIRVVVYVPNAAAIEADRNNEQVIFKNCAPFTDCIKKINNTQVDNAKDLDIVMTMYNLLEYSDSYVKTSGSLWQCGRDEPDNNITDSESCKFKLRLANNTGNDGTENVQIAVPLNYLSSFWRNLEIPLIHCEISLDLTWSANFIVSEADGEATFAIADTKPYVPVVTMSTQDNGKLLQQLKSGFK